MPFGKPGDAAHAKFVRDLEERWMFYRDQRQNVIRDTLDAWDLYLTQKREFRAKGEEWRANMALPDAFSSVEAKIANLVGIMLSADPVIQPESVRDSDLESARSAERLLDYVLRKNSFPKWLTKLLRGRSVAGTSFYKMTWVDQAHTVTLSRSEKAVQRFEAAIAQAAQMEGVIPPPDWMTEPEAFEQWRQLVNDARHAGIPAMPLDGPQRIVRYRGPKLHVLPLTSVYLDPLIDELSEQNLIIHRVVKSAAWLEKRVAAGLYDEEAVAYAMDGWDGQRVEQEEVELAMKLGITTDAGGAADPYYAKAVELWEAWQPDAEYPYTLSLNRKAVINKNPTEMPFLHGESSIGVTRATVIPGHFYGVSDLKPPADLFWEKRKLRNLRLDAVTLNVLPAYLKLKEVGLPEMMHKIRPGALIPASRPDAIKPLLRDPLPPEAFQEPAEMDRDIADAMGVYASTKGAPAVIGRVTGTEFQGRENRAQIRFKLDSTFLEEDLLPIARQAIAMYVQMGDDPLILKVGGDPDPTLTMDRTQLMESIDTTWRFRGPNKAINRDMQVQQLLMWVQRFGNNLTPVEFRYAARLVLDLLDVRGASNLVSADGTQQKVQEYQMQVQLAQQTQRAQMTQANAASVPAPATTSPEAADTATDSAPPQGGEGQ